MAEVSGLITASLVLLALFMLINKSEQLQSSQVQTLLRIQHLLNYPSILDKWNDDTDFCNAEPSSTVTVVCYEDSITQLHIIGVKVSPPLASNFSIDALFTTLIKLPSLKVLKLVSLGLWGPLPGKISRLSALEILNLSSNFFSGRIPDEIVSLTSFQTVILDNNMFTGELPRSLDSLSVLAVLSLKNNSLSGILPDSLGSLRSLRILELSDNRFSGKVPDLSNLENIQVLDLENNSLGPKFPSVGSKIQTLILRKNKFSYGIPEEVQSYYQLEHLDLSSNRFQGPFPPSVLSLPSLNFLNIAENKFTGMLFENQACGAELRFVNLSSNLLSGKVPSCLLSGSKNKIVQLDGNCLTPEDESQHPFSFCRNEALAVGILPHHQKQKQSSKTVLALSISGSVVGGIIFLTIVFMIVKKFFAKRANQRALTRSISEKASTVYSSKLLSDARYISQAMKLGALSLPSYRTYSLEELEEATNNFATTSFIGEGSHGQIYRGQLKDGSFIAIRCLKMKKSQSTQNFMDHIELISKLRHQHLVSALGHCFECYLDDSSVSSIFLVFEYIPNGILRSWVSEEHARRRLSWPQRIGVAIGVAKGIQFLHTGIVPGIFSHNLKITDILLDQNLVAKISSYNLPLLADIVKKDGMHNSPGGSKELNNGRAENQDKHDIYDFGVILLEILTGKQINFKSEVEYLRAQLLLTITTDDIPRKAVVDHTVKNSCSDESLKTMLEICCRCLHNEAAARPSIEDVLWNLQFAAQVQDAWRGDSQSSDSSPLSPFRFSRLQLRIQ